MTVIDKEQVLVKSQAQEQTINSMLRVLDIFKTSDAEIRPHFVLTGPSGSGKSYTIQCLAEQKELKYVEINAAQLTKEGTSGNSLSKALAPLQSCGDKPVVVFVDEFDKLFISGNSNSSLAHESTNGVQNEFLKVLESSKATISGDYGKYFDIPIDNCLFVFAGAFNGEKNISVDKLRDFGIKTEFIGRVGIVFNLEKLSLNTLLLILKNSSLLKRYLDLFEDVKKQDVIDKLSNFITQNYENNTLGARLVNTLVHQYFINDGKIGLEDAKKVSFQNKLSFGEK